MFNERQTRLTLARFENFQKVKILERRRRIHRGGAEVAEKGEWKVSSVNSALRLSSSFDLPQDDPEQ